MEKPWDKLRERRKPSMGVGEWKDAETPRVSITRLGPDQVLLRFGSGCNAAQSYSAQGLRCVAEFMNELADQLEGK